MYILFIYLILFICLFSYFSDELITGLRNTRRMTSTARKAFWLLKSINHIGVSIEMIENNILKKPLAVKCDFMEQIFLIFYYFYENQIFFARCKMINFKGESCVFVLFLLCCVLLYLFFIYFCSYFIDCFCFFIFLLILFLILILIFVFSFFGFLTLLHNLFFIVISLCSFFYCFFQRLISI